MDEFPDLDFDTAQGVVEKYRNNYEQARNEIKALKVVVINF